MKYQSRGLSLIEFMIALTLGLLVVSSVLFLFMSNKQTFKITAGKSRLQENARYAEFLLSYNIRMAGFQGCPNLSAITPTNDISNPADNQTLTNSNAILGFDGSSAGSFTPALPSWLTANIASGTSIVPNTDVIVVRQAATVGANLTVNMSNTTSAITVGSRTTFAPGNILIISDCQSSDIFLAAAGTTNTNIVPATALSKAYLTDARVSPLQISAFYLKASPNTNQAGQPIYALYRQNANGTEDELLDGIENMQASYGVDTNNDQSADTYLKASAVTDWTTVNAVYLNLLFSTVENVAAQSTPYTFQGTTVTPADKILRKEWGAFITLRNRTN